MNRCDEWLKQFYGIMPFEEYAMLDRAARLLEGNRTGLWPGDKSPWLPLRGITPSDRYFLGMWNWDAAFHAIGICLWDPELAREQIRIFLTIQRTDGMFPDVWKQQENVILDGGSKPPVFPWATWEIERCSPNTKFLGEAYPALCRNLDFWNKRRGGDKFGLFYYDGEFEDAARRQEWGSYESGWDNSPRWDNGVFNLFAIDLNCYMILAYRAMAGLAERLGRMEEATRWGDKAQALSERVEHTLWDEESECYFDFDHKKNEFNRIVTPASFMPLFIGIASPERAEKMRKIALEHMVPRWPTVSYHDPSFDPLGYWRGRTWINVAYFALKGLKQYGFNELADTGRKTILEMLASSPATFFENYHPISGEPLGVPRFSWSAVFCLKFLLDWNQTESLSVKG